MIDQLDRAIVAALDDLVADTPELGPVPRVAGADRRPRRHRSVLLASAAAVTIAVAGVALIVLVRSPDSGSTPPPSAAPTVGETAAPDGSLTVEPGVTDYYVGPEALGEPAVDLGLFDQLARCTELTPAGTCAQIEGLGFVPLAVYGRDDGEPTVSQPGGDPVSIGTTFTTVSPIDYAWGQTPAPTHATVRGHDAVVFTEPGGGGTIVWPERAGVLVWVSVSASYSDTQLMEIAEGVRRVDGPPTIPDVVVVPGTAGRPFGTGSNSSGGLVVRRSEGEECIGFRFFDEEGCPDGISTLTWVDTITTAASTRFAVVGATPAGVAEVRVTTHEGAVFTTETFSLADYEHRFFRVEVEPSLALTVEWLGTDGAVVEQTDQVRSGTGFVNPTVVRVVDASGVAGAAENLAALMTGPFAGELTDLDEPVNEETVVYYDIGFFGDPPAEATTLAAWLGGAAVERASEDMSIALNGAMENCPGGRDQCASTDLIVVLGSDLAPAWAP